MPPPTNAFWSPNFISINSKFTERPSRVLEQQYQSSIDKKKWCVETGGDAFPASFAGRPQSVGNVCQLRNHYA
jgi:hypothetical protein